MVKLLCADGETVEVPQAVAEQSVLLKGLIEEQGVEEEIPVNQIGKKSTLEKVIVFFTRVVEKDDAPKIQAPLSHTDMTKVVDQWYAEFIDIADIDELRELIMAANYLDNKPLLELACAKFAAAYIKGKTVEEIRKGVGIVNDFTPEEEELIK